MQLHFLGCSLGHTCGPQPGGLDRDSRRRPMPLIILGRRRLRLDMTTQGRGYDHDTSGRRHAAAMSGCSAAVASAVASMASSVSLLAAMITEEAAAAYLARRKRSRFPTWCESVSPHCSYRVPSSLRSRWSPHCSYLRVSGVCGRRTVPTFVSPCTIMVSPLPGRRVLLCASPGIRSWSLCCRSVLNRRSPATNRFRAIPRSVSATVPDRPGSFPLC